MKLHNTALGRQITVRVDIAMMLLYYCTIYWLYFSSIALL